MLTADVSPPLYLPVGAGYVGGPTCAVLAWKCPDVKVTICDLSQPRIDAWNSNELPIFEPGLAEIVFEARGRNLFFTTDVDAAIAEADLIFVSVNTPTKTSGVGAGVAADLCYVEAATRRIAAVSRKGAIIVEKSTVPCRTAESMRQILAATSPQPGISFEILSNPEFLAEGTAVDDLLNPARILIGSLSTPRGQLAQRRLVEVYSKWVSPSAIITTSLWSSELSKLAANALLAQRVSSINSLAAICESTSANIFEVANACGLDPRIGSQFLKAGLGFGGSCFQKDIFNLIYLSNSLALPEVAEYWEQVLKMNEWTKKRFARSVVKKMFSTITRKKIVLAGFAFKKDTGDIREAPAINVARDLLEDGAILRIYDPKVSDTSIHSSLKGFNYIPYSAEMSQPQKGFDTTPSGSYTICPSLAESLQDASALLFITDWSEFKNMSLEFWMEAHEKMTRPAFVFDGRDILNLQQCEQLRKIGFAVEKTGVGC